MKEEFDARQVKGRPVLLQVLWQEARKKSRALALMRSPGTLGSLERAHPVTLAWSGLRLGKRWRNTVVDGNSPMWYLWSVSCRQEY